MSQPFTMPLLDIVLPDQPLQGQLNYGIAESASELLIQIAGEDGYSFLTEDLMTALEMQIEQSDEHLSAVA